MKRILVILLGIIICFTIFGCAEQPSLSIGAYPENMNMYEEYQMEINSTGIDLSNILWTSSDTSVVTVKDGLITAVGSGTAIVTAIYKDFTHSGEIYVARNKVAHVLVASKESLTLSVGDEEKVTVSLKESGSVVDDANIVYESSDSEIVSVDQEGNVKALKRGNVIVSAYVCYKGHELVKDIPVRSAVMESKATTLALQDDSTSGNFLTEMNNEKTQFGFLETETAYHYVTNGGMSSRIFSNEAYKENNVANYDRLVFKIRFTQVPESGTVAYLANYKKGVKCDNKLISRDNCFLYYDENGNIANSFDVNTTYTVSIDLNKTGTGVIKGGRIVYEYGFAFSDAADAYVGAAILCSEDYASYALKLAIPEKLPNFTCMYAENYKVLDQGEEPIEGFEKYWYCYSTGTQAAWDELMWTNRITVGGVPYSKYKKYDYMRMDIMFTSVNMRSIFFWTGGDMYDYSPSGALSKSNIIPGYDFTVFLGDTDVTGQPLLVGKVYTFRIRITGKDLDYETTAYGFNINSPTADIVYVSNPMMTNY